MAENKTTTMGLGNDRDDRYHYVVADESGNADWCSYQDTPGMHMQDIVTCTNESEAPGACNTA